MRFPKLIAMTAVASLSLAACGSSTPATTGVALTSAPGATAAPTAAAATQAIPTAPPVAAGSTLSPADAAAKLCSVVTAADVKKALGGDYGAGVADQYGLCTYRVGGVTANDGKGQLILALQYEPMSLIKSSFSSGGSTTNVSGHDAFWNPSSGLQSLWVDVGNGALLVLSFDPITNDMQAAAEALATLIVGKL